MAHHLLVHSSWMEKHSQRPRKFCALLLICVQSGFEFQWGLGEACESQRVYKFSFSLSYSQPMVVLDGLPTKTGVCGCWLPTNASLPVRGRACHHKHGTETLSDVRQAPCLYGFLSSYNNAFPGKYRWQIPKQVKKNYNRFFPLISLLESFLKGLIISLIQLFSKSDIGEAETFYKNEYGKDCLRKILESCLLSQPCLSCQSHYLIAFSCHYVSDSHTSRFFCSTPLPCIFSCLVYISSWRCSRFVRLVRF